MQTIGSGDWISTIARLTGTQHWIRAVANGQGLIAPEVTRRLIARFAATAPDPARKEDLERLSEREREVLLEVAQGRSNGQIARRLFIEEATIKSHVSSILLKLGLRSRVQVVILAYETGLVSPGAPAET